MNIRILLPFLFIASITVRADINSVVVPQGMVHPPSSDMGLQYTGKVEYTLTAGNYDSVFVTLTILPAAGGAALSLKNVSGDVGVVRVAKPRVAESHEIFFEVASVQANTPCIARVVAIADSSSTKRTVEHYLNNMVKTEKIKLLAGNGGAPNGIFPILRDVVTKTGEKVPGLRVCFGPAGVMTYLQMHEDKYDNFPLACCIASTWDTAMSSLHGKALSWEYRASGGNCAHETAMNLVYSPLDGRAAEYFSEDPFLSGWMGVANVRGHQDAGVIACVKHFACNNKEDNRASLNVNMSERSMRELYLYNFYPAIVKADCWGIMSAYNRVNNTYCCYNKYLLTTVLRDDWGFKYHTVTDWWSATDNFQLGIMWGVDLRVPDPADYTAANLTATADSLIDMHARRVLYSHAMIGDLKPGYNPFAYTTSPGSDTVKKIIRRIGTEGIILAKNVGNILPLPLKGAKIAVTGSFARQFVFGVASSAYVIPPASVQITPYQGIVDILTAAGTGASTIVTDINAADYVVVFVGQTAGDEMSDRTALTLTSGNTEAQAALNAKPTKTIVVYCGGSASLPGAWSNAPAVLFAFYPGQEQARAIADALFGNVNPGGKLPISFPASAAQLPPFTLVNSQLNYPSSDTAHGYFRMDKTNQKPLFYFGHGLSYTTFAYSNLRIFPAAISAGDRVRVAVDVSNTGQRAGKEVVELYLSMPAAAGLPVRVQDLRGFAKLTLGPGAKATAEFTLTAEEMRVWDSKGADYSGSGAWRILPGTYGVRVGTSSERTREPTLSSSFAVN